MKNLTKSQIEATSSQYLKEGRKHEAWEITSIAIDDYTLIAEVNMTQTYISSTDGNGFHLTVFSSLEILSQLMITWGHDRAKLDSKTGECWMAESSIKSLSSIRSTKLNVTMNVKKFKIRQNVIYVKANFVIDGADPNDGQFTASLTGFLS